VYDTEPTIDQILTVLAEQPKEIGALTADLPRARVNGSPRRGEWSVNDVLPRWLANHERSHMKHIARLVDSPRSARPASGTPAR